MAEAQRAISLAPVVDLPSKWNFEALTDGGELSAILSGTATLDFGSIAANLAADLTITVNGARANDPCLVAPPAAPDAEIVFTAFVSSNDTVTVRAANSSIGAVDPASAVYRVMVFHFA